MKIGVLGAGHVGGTVGKRLAQGGHQVIFSSRHPDSPELQQLVRDSGQNACSGTVAETVAASDVLFLATPWPATQAVLAEAGDLTGKILLDATNPVKPDLSGLEFSGTDSAGLQVASWAPGAKVVKVMNTVGVKIMADPKVAAGPATMLYAGDDADAKRVAHQLAAELGFEPLDAGPLSQAYLLEHFALLWISLAFKQSQGMEFAFRLSQRQ